MGKIISVLGIAFLFAVVGCFFDIAGMYYAIKYRELEEVFRSKLGYMIMSMGEFFTSFASCLALIAVVRMVVELIKMILNIF